MTFTSAMVQLTCGKSVHSIYWRHDCVHKTNTKLWNLNWFLASKHTGKDRQLCANSKHTGKDRQLCANSRAVCSHARVIQGMNHRQTEKPLWPSWCFDRTNDRQTEDTIHGCHGDHPDFWINGGVSKYYIIRKTQYMAATIRWQSWCFDQWVIEQMVRRSKIRRHEK
jgi:hypothetical protein